MKNIVHGWHLIRLLRLVLGTIMLVQAIQLGDKLLGAVGLILLYQAIWAKGCCGAATCAPSYKTSTTQQTEEINFEEIKKI